MHEFSICQGMLGQVTNIVREHGAESVSHIRVRIGPLSGVEPRLLKEAFTIARAGGVAAEAELLIEELSVRVHCSQCGADSDATPNRLLCADCGNWQTQLISGDELLLASVELNGPAHEEPLSPGLQSESR
ncbi:hydrogenase maturation nickel metallochaperone HypA/HybF [Thiohalomonas denitrificans]|uniref:hydrogenase maturation nickel metallochaperone HypA/HybF n=1 Tax=Thiohalomonas denitrificans TaxID=415747 RepID=UPI0026EF9F6F|nr:hydrogenase maturation nickel metallochaperone HypA [Thiohalomonas denitrificans]